MSTIYLVNLTLEHYVGPQHQCKIGLCLLCNFICCLDDLVMYMTSSSPLSSSTSTTTLIGPPGLGLSHLFPLSKRQGWTTHKFAKMCYFHSYRPTHWLGFGKLEKLASLEMMKSGRRAYDDPFLWQHWSQQELSSIHPALFSKIFIIYKSQILWSEMFTSCRPRHYVYQGTVQCFSALTNREKVLFFPIKALGAFGVF